MNPALTDGAGTIPANTLALRVDRTIAGGVHEDIDLTNHHQRPVTVLVTVRIWSDFADLFDVKLHTLVPRGTAGRATHLIGGADVAAELDAKRAIDQGSRLAAAL